MQSYLGLKNIKNESSSNFEIDSSKSPRTNRAINPNQNLNFGIIPQGGSFDFTEKATESTKNNNPHNFSKNVVFIACDGKEERLGTSFYNEKEMGIYCTYNFYLGNVYTYVLCSNFCFARNYKFIFCRNNCWFCCRWFKYGINKWRFRNVPSFSSRSIGVIQNRLQSCTGFWMDNVDSPNANGYFIWKLVANINSNI